METSFTLRLRDGRHIVLFKPSVMGILNTSPDSFYKPQRSITEALHTAENMLQEGAVVLDIGGEATNPSVSQSPQLEQELDRVVPLVKAIKARFSVWVSVDTSQPEVMRAAVEAGADLINDQRALRSEEALMTAVSLQVPVCLMHWFHPTRVPGSCDAQTLLRTIQRELQDTVLRCERAGIARDRLLIDPGFGQGHYGKNASENFYLLAHLSTFLDLGLPMVTGLSRKSPIGEALSAPPQDRLFGSIAADTLAAWQGSCIIRTHDVRATVEALKIVRHVKSFN